MAINFPNGATNGQKYTAGNGSVYRFDGQKWVVDGAKDTLSSVNNFTASYYIDSASFDSILDNLVSATSSYLTSETDSQTLSINGTQLSISNGNTITIPTGSTLPPGVISGSSQLQGTTIQNLSGSFTGSFKGDVVGSLTGTALYSSNVAVVTTNTTNDSTLYPVFTNTSASNANNTLKNHPSGTFYYDGITRKVYGETFVGAIEATNGVISGSSQLTSSYDSRYVISGSITQTTWDNIASKPTGIISGSSQLTSSYDTRYTLSGSINATPAGTISGSSQLTSSFDTRYAPSASYITSINGAISSSTQITNGSGIISSSAQLPSGLISGSSQLTASYDSRYALSGSVLTSFSQSVDSRLDVVETFSSSLSVLANSATKILDNASYTSATAWSGSYIGNGGTVKVEANFTLFSSTNNSTKTLYLYRDGIIVDSGSFYFNAANQHLVMPNLYYVGSNETGTHSYSVGHNASSDVSDYCTIVVTETFNSLNAGLISGSSQLTASFDVRYLTIGGDNVISGSSQLTASFDVRYALSGSGGSATIPAGTISGSSQLTSSFDGRYLLTQSFNSFTASAQTVTTGSNSFNGTQTITGSLVITSGSFIGSQILANTSSLYLTSGSNLYMQNNGLVEITGSLIVSGSTNFKNNISVGTGSLLEGGEIDLAYAQSGNTTLTGSSVAFDVYGDKVRIFEGGGNSRGVSIDLSKAPTGVGGDLMWKTSGLLNTGSFVQMDNIKAGPTRNGAGGGFAGLSIGAVSTSFVADVSATYANNANGGTSITNTTYTTTPGNSWNGWGFTQGQHSTYIVNDTINNRVYRIILMIGPSYNNNFTSIERLY